MSVIVVDPKGDRRMREELADAAHMRARPMIRWTPDGPSVYNPYARGTDSEIADKALAGERFTEPHYLRQAQRYLGHEVRALRAAGLEVSLGTLVEHLAPARLELLARSLPEPLAGATHTYLDALTSRQQSDLSGVRDRLSILAESDFAAWLDPDTSPGSSFDLLQAIRSRAIVYFDLQSDSRPLLAQMLGVAIVIDLQTAVAALQRTPTAALVVIDEFSAIAAEQVTRLFGRARAAGVSLLLGTQELSDLRVAGRETVLEQVLGNLSALISHRQVVPDSGELVSRLAGSHGAWRTSQGSDGRWTRTRVSAPLLAAESVRALPDGCAAVIDLGGDRSVCVAQMLCAGAPRAASAPDCAKAHARAWRDRAGFGLAALTRSGAGRTRARSRRRQSAGRACARVSFNQRKGQISLHEQGADLMTRQEKPTSSGREHRTTAPRRRQKSSSSGQRTGVAGQQSSVPDRRSVPDRQRRAVTREQSETLRWIGSLGGVSAEALACHLDVSLASARGRLSVARRSGWIASSRPLADRPTLYTATASGLRAGGARGIEPACVSAAGAAHLLACAHVAAALERCYPEHRVLGERELRHHEREHGHRCACAELGVGAHGEPQLHRCDLVLWPNAHPGTMPVAVEVELTTKAPARLAAICRAWARSREIAGVLYLAPRNVARALQRAVDRAEARERIVIVGLETLPWPPELEDGLVESFVPSDL